MDNCIPLGFLILIGGVVFLLSSVTKAGHDFDPAYLKASKVRSKGILEFRTAVGKVGGTILTLIGLGLMLKGIHHWWYSIPCSFMS
jgi:hypothetical protein